MRLMIAASGAAIALLGAAPAAGHLSASPGFLAAGSTETLVLSVHNDRTETMTGFALTVPGDFRIAEARPAAGWREEHDGTTATWRGGSLAADTGTPFTVAVEAPTSPGPATFEGAQLYADDAARWPVAITVVPPTESSGGIVWPLVTVVAGLIVLAGIGAAFVRRSRSLQEK